MDRWRRAGRDAAFALPDLDGDGWMSKSEFVSPWGVEFWAGDDKDAPGTHLFGGFNGRTRPPDVST
ncbi:MAG: hypothetical protein HOV76_21140 [Hamadaea sp.]|nr:hypothetical protein [Hamadaea sp.]